VFTGEGDFGVAEGHILTLHSFRLAVHEVSVEGSEAVAKQTAERIECSEHTEREIVFPYQANAG